MGGERKRGKEKERGEREGDHSPLLVYIKPLGRGTKVRTTFEFIGLVRTVWIAVTASSDVDTAAVETGKLRRQASTCWRYRLP